MNPFALIRWSRSKDRESGSPANATPKRLFQGKSLHSLALDWAIRCFGLPHMLDVPVRATRAAEEMIEFAQCAGVTPYTLHRLVDSVYSRPVGSMDAELGQVLMTVYLFCIANEKDPDTLFETELRRVLAKPHDEFRKRESEKRFAGAEMAFEAESAMSPRAKSLANMKQHMQEPPLYHATGTFPTGEPK